MDSKYDTIYRECLAFFERNYPNVGLSEKNWYVRGLLDVIQRLQNKNL